MAIKNGNLKDVITGWYYGWEDHMTTPNGSLFRHGDILYSYGYHFPLAIRVNGGVLLNGDKYSVSTSKHQSYCMGVISENARVEVPFSAIASALGVTRIDPIDLRDNLSILDNQSDKYIDSGRVNKDGDIIYTHVLGGSLIKYKNRYFLSGIDETGKGNGSYFLTELVRPVESLEEAYKSLKPQQVLEAEEQGKDVRRQGEWFFIALDGDYMKPFNRLARKNYSLSESHTVSKGCTMLVDGKLEDIVQGVVRHFGGDHKQVKLYDDVKAKGLYLAYHNVQIESYNAVGNVD